MKQKSPLTLRRLSVTSLSQYVRLENCERFLRFRLCRDEERALLKKWNLTIQPLTPLLKDSGAEFEENVASQVAKEGEQVVDLTGEDLQATLDWLHKSRKPVILLQPILEGQLGNYHFNGRADLVRLHRNRQGQLHILIVDIKASRQERMEHRLQVAIYARLLQGLAQAEGLTIANLEGAVLHLQEDGSIPSLTSETPTFDLNTYLTIVDHLVEAPDSVVNRVATLPFEEVSYHMGYKCDGCLYNAICMYDSAERLDLSLVTYITAVEKRVLRNTGIKTLPQLAMLMELPQPGTNKSELTVASGQEEMVAQLANQ